MFIGVWNKSRGRKILTMFFVSLEQEPQQLTELWARLVPEKNLLKARKQSQSFFFNERKKTFAK